MSVGEVKEACAFVKKHFAPDVFKVAGGEPTLHPALDAILQAVKEAELTHAIRVITNGLLLHKMSEAFWQLIDQLTVSHYISAPIRPKVLEEIKVKAREHEVVLNIKYVEQFNEIFVEEPFKDRERLEAIYRDCWMRHRCLILRHGRFYKCTRSAYMDEFLKLKGLPLFIEDSDICTYSAIDGIFMDDPDFKMKALDYLNQELPLHSCSYCLGVSGNLRANVQLKRNCSHNSV